VSRLRPVAYNYIPQEFMGVQGHPGFPVGYHQDFSKGAAAAPGMGQHQDVYNGGATSAAVLPPGPQYQKFAGRPSASTGCSRALRGHRRYRHLLIPDEGAAAQRFSWRAPVRWLVPIGEAQAAAEHAANVATEEIVDARRSRPQIR